MWGCVPGCTSPKSNVAGSAPAMRQRPRTDSPSHRPSRTGVTVVPHSCLAPKCRKPALPLSPSPLEQLHFATSTSTYPSNQRRGHVEFLDSSPSAVDALLAQRLPSTLSIPGQPLLYPPTTKTTTTLRDVPSQPCWPPNLSPPTRTSSPTATPLLDSKRAIPRSKSYGY